MPRTVSEIFSDTHPTGKQPLSMGADQFPAYPGITRAPKETIERLFTTVEAARFLRVGNRTLLRFISDGKLTASFIGRGYAITETSLAQFIKQQQNERAHANTNKGKKVTPQAK